MSAASTPRKLVEVAITRDHALDLADGSWVTVRVRPPGNGWAVLRDDDRKTVWTRRRAVAGRLMRRQRRGARWLP